ncbi:MAG: hypothetical protein AB7S46_10290, partial [Flavobacteriaceae bacterium]
MNRTLLAHPVLIFASVVAFVTISAPFVGIPLGRVTEISVYSLYAAAVGILVSYAGLVPFGASLFFGVASYTCAILILRVTGEPLSALLAGAASSGLIAIILGPLILRRRGLYFSLLTLAASQIAFEIAFRWTDL